MRRIRLLALTCVVGAVGGGVTGADAAQATTYLPGRCFDLKVKPTRVILACGDAGLFLSGMHWTDWGKPRGHGTGRMLANDCDPSCVDGMFISYQVRVTLSGRKRCRGNRFQYTRVRYSFPEDSPFPPDSPGARNPVTSFHCQDGRPPME
jgi:hypothetical protein